MTATTFTPHEISQRYRVNINVVLDWLKTGELQGFSVTRTPDPKKPRWRISEDALAAFELRRTVGTTVVPASKRRRPASSPVIDFFPQFSKGKKHG